MKCNNRTLYGKTTLSCICSCLVWFSIFPISLDNFNQFCYNLTDITSQFISKCVPSLTKIFALPSSKHIYQRNPNKKCLFLQSDILINLFHIHVTLVPQFTLLPSHIAAYCIFCTPKSSAQPQLGMYSFCLNNNPKPLHHNIKQRVL